MRIGLDIGGTKTAGVLIDDAGDLIARNQAPTGLGADAVVATALAMVDELTALGGAPVTHIGIGIPGTVTDGVVHHAVNLDVVELELARIVAAATGATVEVENDVKAAAMGAWRADAADGLGSLAYLNLGTGLAAGIVLDGRLLRGRWGAAGEIGHILVDPAGPIGTDGTPGGLEAIASGSGLARQWPVESGSPLAALLAAADAGDERAAGILAGFWVGVAGAIRILVLAVDPDRIVIGGGLAGLGERLLGEVGGVLADWQAASPFLGSLPMLERVRLVDPTEPIAAIGAAWLGAVDVPATGDPRG